MAFCVQFHLEYGGNLVRKMGKRSFSFAPPSGRNGPSTFDTKCHKKSVIGNGLETWMEDIDVVTVEVAFLSRISRVAGLSIKSRFL